jgi:uncharacterized protein YndB with AHSA1/START domain
MTEVVLIAVGLLVAAVVAVVVIGALLPKGHTATRSARFNQPPEAVWAAITDIDGFPGWRPGVTRVEHLAGGDGRQRWREHDRQGKITFEVVEAAPPARLVVRIADAGLPYGGSWTYVVAPAGDGASTLTVTEDGEVYNPVFRFVSRFVLGHTAGLEKYLKALGAKFGETVTAA